MDEIRLSEVESPMSTTCLHDVCRGWVMVGARVVGAVVLATECPLAPCGATAEGGAEALVEGVLVAWP